MCHSDIGTTKVYADLLNKTKAKALLYFPDSTPETAVKYVTSTILLQCCTEEVSLICRMGVVETTLRIKH